MTREEKRREMMAALYEETRDIAIPCYQCGSPIKSAIYICNDCHRPICTACFYGIHSDYADCWNIPMMLAMRGIDERGNSEAYLRP